MPKAGRRSKNDLRRRAAHLSGNPAEDPKLRENLLKLRAVIFILGIPYGSRGAAVTATREALAKQGIDVCRASLYNWRKRYLRWGFAGIARRDRRDKGRPRKAAAEVWPQIVDAATRVRFPGDIAREFRKIRPQISYESWRRLVRSVQNQIGVIEMPRRSAD